MLTGYETEHKETETVPYMHANTKSKEHTYACQLYPLPCLPLSVVIPNTEAQMQHQKQQHIL